VRAAENAGAVRMPAVALTAYGRVEDRLRTLAAGYSMHMPKPAASVRSRSSTRP